MDFYETRFSRIDGLHREVEQVAAEISPVTGPLVKVMAVARERYQTAADSLARHFQSKVVDEGWPAHSRQRAVDVFDLVVEPLWKSGKRVAIFWIDALRYDLALSLESTLARRHKTKIESVCGQLPGITSIGMAALLPGASSSFELIRDGESVIPVVAGRRIDSAKARAEALAAHIGIERVRVLDLEDAATGKLGSNPDAIEVLAVKTTDIDSLGENNPDYFLKLIPEILRKIELAVNRLADAGFHHAVLATDHGFCWMVEVGAGGAIKKPAGDWAISKDRCLLGTGAPDGQSVAVESRAAGIRSDLPLYVCPAGLATYTAGITYFHGGLSLQENLLPVIQVDLKAAKTRSGSERVQINLSYRGATTGRVTSLVPSIELAYPASDLFGPPSVRLILQGFDKKGTIIANPAASPMVDPTTGEIHLDRGKAIKIPLRIQEGYEGDITVQAADPSSGLAHATLKLTTDFHH